MNILEDIRNIVEKKKHYLTVLNEINRYMTEEGHTKYSAFFMKRQQKYYLAATVGDWNMVDTMKIELIRKDGKNLGYWLIDDQDIPRNIMEAIASYLVETLYFEEWEHDYAFNQNKSCEYFPCHKIDDEDKFSCLFCYCPLYLIKDCGGKYVILENGVKDCSGCILPHKRDNYDYVIKKLSKGI